ncbi:MAG: hypothetical protein M3O50_10105 [Myxococcota bacterium]|nr:hypothetical protein [Myxococcota bacterium]
MNVQSRAAFVAFLLIACRNGHHARIDDSRARVVDAALDAHDAGGVTGADATPPPSDTSLPATTDDLLARARHLLEAVEQDDPSLASDIVFPRDGWLATRDAADLGRDWDLRMATPFRKAVHVLSRRLHHPSQAQVVSVELGGAVEQATPRRHAWKKPLWTVSSARVIFVVDGHTRTLAIREMTAWRGAWYVTRLR